MYDVTVIGPAVIDILASPFDMEVVMAGFRDLDQIKMSFGGDALNESVVLARLGKKVQLISKVGDDVAGRRIISYLEENGVPADGVRAQQGLDTAINIALIDRDGGRRFLMNPHSSLRMLGPEDVLPRVDRMAGIVSFASMFISPLFTIEEMETLFSEIKKSGRMLVVDVTRPKNGETFEDIRRLLSYIDVFAPNDEEIGLLTGIRDPRRNARLLTEAGVKAAVIKTGSEGCLVGTDGRLERVPAVPGVRCVDTTGAGDTFTAGLIAGLCEGRELTDCARLGCAAASCSIEQIGATDGVRDLSRVMERYAEIR
ncbi:MAG: carbohydrate kinase family protein [Eubacteriales bacterium]|nr:carbohydrate kinase family protein [Eubacteriales bacterium]